MGVTVFPPGLVEPVPVEDDLCSRLGFLEDFCGVAVRFYLVTDQRIAETGETISAIKRKIILPYDAVLPGMEMTGRFITRHTIQRVGNIIKLPAR